jgi:hypothetical protein
MGAGYRLLRLTHNSCAGSFSITSRRFTRIPCLLRGVPVAIRFTGSQMTRRGSRDKARHNKSSGRRSSHGRTILFDVKFLFRARSADPFGIAQQAKFPKRPPLFDSLLLPALQKTYPRPKARSAGRRAEASENSLANSIKRPEGVHSYSPAFCANVSTTAMFCTNSGGSPCRSCK